MNSQQSINSSIFKPGFENYGDDLYPELLIAVSLPALGYFGGFYQGMHSDRNFSIFYPDVPPEMWIEEADFIDFNDRIIFLANYPKTKKAYMHPDD